MTTSTPVPPTVPDQPKPLTKRRFDVLLRTLGACPEAVEWSKQFGNDGVAAWNQCERGDWLLWAAVRIGVDRWLVVRAAARCAETALQYVPADEERPRQCIEAVLAWCDDPSDQNLERVGQARRAAYGTYDTDAAAYAVYAATYAADAAYAVYAATYAADAADAADAATRREALKCCAEIVQQTISVDVVLAAAEVSR